MKQDLKDAFGKALAADAARTAAQRDAQERMWTEREKFNVGYCPNSEAFVLI
jgi:hypothetical protein